MNAQFSTGPIFSTTTGYSEIDQLNHILSVERELVLKTQENYKILKEKYLDLERENDILKMENDRLNNEQETINNCRYNFSSLEGKGEALIQNIKIANEDREERNERFKVSTIEELQNIFRKELKEENDKIEKLKKDKNELIEENDFLIEKNTKLLNEFEDLKREQKLKEQNLKKEFNEKLNDFLTKNESNNSPRIAHLNVIIDDLRKEIFQIEVKNAQQITDLTSQIKEKNRKIEEKSETEIELQKIIRNLESELEKIKEDVNSNRNKGNNNKEIIASLRRNIDVQTSEKLKLESKLLKNDRDWEKKLFDIEERFERKYEEFEKLCAAKDLHISDLSEKIDELENIKEHLHESEKCRRIEEEQRESLENELKQLYVKIELIGEEKEKQLSQFKSERDNLEQSVAQLKKKLVTTPDTIEQCTKLKNELDEIKNKRNIEKEKYHIILAEMKAALKSIENQQRNTQQKLRETIISRY